MESLNKIRQQKDIAVTLTPHETVTRKKILNTFADYGQYHNHQHVDLKSLELFCTY